MSSMDQFVTQTAGNEGRKIPLHTPLGEETKEYLVIRSIDSDAYQLAKIKRDRAFIRVADLETDEERDLEIKDIKTDILASLVCGWSFDQECNHKNIKSFLNRCPQIAEMIDKQSAQRAFFLAPTVSSSKGMRKSK